MKTLTPAALTPLVGCSIVLDAIHGKPPQFFALTSFALMSFETSRRVRLDLHATLGLGGHSMPHPQTYPAILIAEDEYVFAAEMAAWIEEYCLNPLGPVSSVQAAKDLLDTVDRPDAAILDIQLRG